MRKIPTSRASRGLELLKLAGSSVRLAKSDAQSVADNSRRFLSQSMGRIKGLPQKIGQILKSLAYNFMRTCCLSKPA